MTSRRIYLFDVAVEWNIFLSWREMNNFDLTLSPYIFERQPFFFLWMKTRSRTLTLSCVARLREWVGTQARLRSNQPRLQYRSVEQQALRRCDTYSPDVTVPVRACTLPLPISFYVTNAHHGYKRHQCYAMRWHRVLRRLKPRWCNL